MLKKLFKLTFYALPLIAFMLHRDDPRAAVAVSWSAARTAPPLKIAIRQSQHAPGAIVPAAAVEPLRFSGATPSPREVKAYVRTEAANHGVDPQLALWIVRHESSFNPRARGDGDASRGLWQISKIYHPEVTDDQAFSVRSSTEWSLERIRDGKVSEWSSYRNCRELYANCPY